MNDVEPIEHGDVDPEDERDANHPESSAQGTVATGTRVLLYDFDPTKEPNHIGAQQGDAETPHVAEHKDARECKADHAQGELPAGDSHEGTNRLPAHEV